GDTPVSLSSQGVKEVRLPLWLAGSPPRCIAIAHRRPQDRHFGRGARLARWMDQSRRRDRDLTAGRYGAVRLVTYGANGPLFTMGQVSVIFSERSAHATDWVPARNSRQNGDMSTPSNQSIERAVAVLEAISSSEGGTVRASDVARAIGLGASTTGRLLGTLESLGYVRRERHGYAIGNAVLALASRGLNHNPVHRESRSRAQELARRIGLTANVGVLDGGSCTYLCHFEGELAPKSHTMIGMHQPLHASALGKALMLDMTESARRELLNALPRYTDKTITDHEVLSADLEEARHRGWCMENQEIALGRFCIAAPLRAASGNIVAEISISGRITDLRTKDLDSMAEDVIEVA